MLASGSITLQNIYLMSAGSHLDPPLPHKHYELQARRVFALVPVLTQRSASQLGAEGTIFHGL